MAHVFSNPPPLDLLNSILSNKPGPKRFLRQFLGRNVLLRFCQIKFLILFATQNHEDALPSVFDDLERQQGSNAMFIIFFILNEKKCICGTFQLNAAVPEKLLYIFLALYKICYEHSSHLWQ